MTADAPFTRDASTVLLESVDYLALVATRRLYEEQPALWELGEAGRARTLEDFGHHLRALAGLSEPTFRRHVDYCEQLFTKRDFPHRWLEDAWRIMETVLQDELPEHVHALAVGILRAVTRRVRSSPTS